MFAQIQAQLGLGCVNIINALDVFLTPTHLALVMDYAAGGNLTTYVADRHDGWMTVHLLCCGFGGLLLFLWRFCCVVL